VTGAPRPADGNVSDGTSNVAHHRRPRAFMALIQRWASTDSSPRHACTSPFAGSRMPAVARQCLRWADANYCFAGESDGCVARLSVSPNVTATGFCRYQLQVRREHNGQSNVRTPTFARKTAATTSREPRLHPGNVNRRFPLTHRVSRWRSGSLARSRLWAPTQQVRLAADSRHRTARSKQGRRQTFSASEVRRRRMWTS